MSHEIRLRIEINNRTPVELGDFTRSLSCMADEYRRFLAARESRVDADNIKLYVEAINTGSIITDLVALSPFSLDLIENTKTVVEFAKYLKASYDTLLGRPDAAPVVLEKPSLQNLSQLLEPVAKDRGSQIQISTVNVNGDNNQVTFVVNSLEANAAQNSAQREQERLREPSARAHDKVLMYWWQARNDMGTRAGDKAKIESIHDGPVKTIFLDDGIKSAMLIEEAHPFKKGFVVDVVVETVNGKPMLYKVTRLHEAFDLDA